MAWTNAKYLETGIFGEFNIILWKCKVCMEGKEGWGWEEKLKLVVYKDMKFSEVDYNCFYEQVS